VKCPHKEKCQEGPATFAAPLMRRRRRQDLCPHRRARHAATGATQDVRVSSMRRRRHGGPAHPCARRAPADAGRRTSRGDRCGPERAHSIHAAPAARRPRPPSPRATRAATDADQRVASCALLLQRGVTGSQVSLMVRSHSNINAVAGVTRAPRNATPRHPVSLRFVSPPPLPRRGASQAPHKPALGDVLAGGASEPACLPFRGSGSRDQSAPARQP